jgi:CHAD domain-containing protein
MARIQVLTDDAEREAFRAQAKREGRSLSEWLREAGRDRLHAAQAARLRTPEDLDDFFAEIDARRGDDRPEEDWEQHRARIEASRVRGLPDDV